MNDLQAQQQARLQELQQQAQAFQQANQPANPNAYPGLLAGPGAVGGWMGQQLGQGAGQAGGALMDALRGVGQFLSQIGHPMAQSFNQMHGFQQSQNSGFDAQGRVIPGMINNALLSDSSALQSQNADMGGGVSGGMSTGPNTFNQVTPQGQVVDRVGFGMQPNVSTVPAGVPGYVGK